MLVHITRKASRKLDNDDLFFNQNHPNGQKMISKEFTTSNTKAKFSTKQDQMHFQSSYKTLLILSGSYSKKIPHIFLQLTSNTTDILRELLVKNTAQCSRVYIKQY